MIEQAHPFEVIGLNQKALHGCSQSEAAELSDALRKALTFIHHPDRGGDTARAAEISSTYADLTREGSGFTSLLDTFLRAGSFQEELEAEQVWADIGQLENNYVSLNFLRYLQALAKTTPELTVMNAAPCELILEDVIPHHKGIGFERTDFREMDLRSASDDALRKRLKGSGREESSGDVAGERGRLARKGLVRCDLISRLHRVSML